MTLKKRLRPAKKSSELRHVSRKTYVKIFAVELLAQKDLTQIWRNTGMTRECPAAISTVSGFGQRGMGMHSWYQNFST